jgi:hypothetical protein
VTFEPSGANVPGGALTPGADYEWSVRVACEVTPDIVTTPQSATNSFTASTLRVADAATLSVFPNPATEVAVVTFNAAEEGEAILRIVDMAGKTVASQEIVAAAGANNANFDVADFAAGQYTIEIAQGFSVETLTLSVQ